MPYYQCYQPLAFIKTEQQSKVQCKIPRALHFTFFFMWWFFSISFHLLHTCNCNYPQTESGDGPDKAPSISIKWRSIHKHEVRYWLHCFLDICSQHKSNFNKLVCAENSICFCLQDESQDVSAKAWKKNESALLSAMQHPFYLQFFYLFLQYMCNFFN